MTKEQLFNKTWKGGNIEGFFVEDTSVTPHRTEVCLQQTDSSGMKRTLECLTVPQFERFAKMVNGMEEAWRERDKK